MKLHSIFYVYLISFLFFWGCSEKKTIHAITFNERVPEQKWALKELNPDLPSDWIGYKYLVLEMKASSPQRFELGFTTENGLLTKTIHPFSGAWIRFAVPLDFYRRENTKGSEMAATWNQPRAVGWMSIYGGGFGPLKGIDSIYVHMEMPLRNPTLAIRSVTLSKEEVKEEVLDHKPVVDKFGQWVPDNWKGKAHSVEELKKAWNVEESALGGGTFQYSKYGGYANTHTNATGFFHVEMIDGKWWFIDPEGHLFLAAGMNGVNKGTYTRTENRKDIFAELPPEAFRRPARNGSPDPEVSFSAWNLYRRYGDGWKEKWKEMALRRMDAWGLNAVNWSDPVLNDHIAYAKFLYGWGIEEGIMGMPDVYSQKFYDNAGRVAAENCAPLKDDPWLLGYFIGNEPPWPGRESLLVDAVLNGPETATRKVFEEYLAGGDTPERRKAIVYKTFEKFLQVVNEAIKRHDPNHLNLGIRFGGSPSDDVMKMARVFDVYSFNSYKYEIPQEYFDKIFELTGKPVLIGEFHFGTPGRGLAPGLSQVLNLEERGIAYRHYVETAFSHPAVIGTYWFIWRDQPNTGRNDGENYNIGIVDVTDRPYSDMVEAMKTTHSRLYDVHSGNLPPLKTLPEGRISKGGE